jgi:Flp pilus assembly pilin Flp
VPALACRGVRARNRRLFGKEGQTLAEYAMILLFVAVACVIGATLLGSTVQGFYNGFNGSF